MFDNEDLGEVCRDEACDLNHVHPSHVYPLRPTKERPWWLDKDPEAYRRPSARALNDVIRRAFTATDWPLAFGDLVNTVRNDYGSTTPRSIHRHIRRLIDKGFVRELDLGLKYAAYIRADSAFLHDLDNLREHMMGKHAQFNESKRGRAQRQIVQPSSAGELMVAASIGVDYVGGAAP